MHSTAQRRRMSELIDIIAPAEHPGPVALYAAAARKCGADLIQHPELQEAVVLACAMSWYTAALVLGGARHRRTPQIRALVEALGRPGPDPARAPQTDPATGLAGSKGQLDEGWRRRASSKARRLLPEDLVWWASARRAGQPRAAWVDWYGSRGAMRRAVAALPGICRSGERRSPGDERPVGLCDGAGPLECSAAADLAHAVRVRVFRGSAQAPDSVFTLALYAYQTLIVHRPEAYALAGVEGHAAAALARRLRGVDALLAWMRRHVAPGSIFPEEDRVMLPDQVATYGLGRPLDRALLIFAVARRLGLGARVVQTTRRAYALLNDGSGSVLIDAGALRPVSAPQGVVVLAFDEARQVGYGEAWAPPEPAPCPRAVLPARLPRRPVAAASVA